MAHDEEQERHSRRSNKNRLTLSNSPIYGWWRPAWNLSFEGRVRNVADADVSELAAAFLRIIESVTAVCNTRNTSRHVRRAAPAYPGTPGYPLPRTTQPDARHVRDVFDDRDVSRVVT